MGQIESPIFATVNGGFSVKPPEKIDGAGAPNRRLVIRQKLGLASFAQQHYTPPSLSARIAGLVREKDFPGIL